MASMFALRAVVGAGLGLGALDLAWIDLAVGPRAIAPAEAPAEPGKGLRPAEGLRPQASGLTPEAGLGPRASGLGQEAPIAVAPEITRGEPAASSREARAAVTTIYFETGSAALGPAARGALGLLAARVVSGATLTLEGHADYRGDEASNRTLSARRAAAAAAYLVQLGVAEDQLVLHHVGEDAAAPATELWRDRRVDIQLTGGVR